jgi:hypothetical protein
MKAAANSQLKDLQKSLTIAYLESPPVTLNRATDPVDQAGSLGP